MDVTCEHCGKVSQIMEPGADAGPTITVQCGQCDAWQDGARTVVANPNYQEPEGGDGQ